MSENHNHVQEGLLYLLDRAFAYTFLSFKHKSFHKKMSDSTLFERYCIVVKGYQDPADVTLP